MDDFTEDVVTPIIALKALEKKAFMPWHKPRKQWCRFDQWLSGLNWVIDSIGPAEIGCFNYLGLPGDDLLDLRLFAFECGKKNVQLKYLGFNSIDEKSSSSNELRLSESELHKTGVIAAGSKVITEPLESLSRDDSSAFVEAKLHRGFHMINFDLCKSIARRGADYSGDTYFSALKNLLEQQMNYMRVPWVLFITTNVCKESVIDDAMIPLLTAIKDNNDTHAEFSEFLEENLFIDSALVDSSIDNLTLLSDQEFLDAFALGFSKWLLKICFSISPAWSIEMTPSCKYETGYEGGESNMLSLAFRFQYVHQQAVDTYSLAGSSGVGPPRTELDFALAMVAEVGEIFNLDLKMERSPELNASMVQHTAALLADARYEKEEYFEWVDNGCPS